MNEFNEETIRLRANEAMLNSKGFLLFVVCQDGSLEKVCDTTTLSAAERNGLEYFRRKDESSNNIDEDKP